MYTYGGSQLHFAQRAWEWRGEEEEEGDPEIGLANGIPGVHLAQQPLCWVRSAATPGTTLETLIQEARTYTTIRALVVDVATLDDHSSSLVTLARGWRPWNTVMTAIEEEEEEGMAALDEINDGLWYYPTGIGLVHEAMGAAARPPSPLLIPVAAAWLNGAARQLLIAHAMRQPIADAVAVAGPYLRLRYDMSDGGGGGGVHLSIKEWMTCQSLDDR